MLGEMVRVGDSDSQQDVVLRDKRKRRYSPIRENLLGVAITSICVSRRQRKEYGPVPVPLFSS